MYSRLWKGLIFVFIVSGFLTFAACQKEIVSDSAVTSASEESSTRPKDWQKAQEEELARQRRLEEERLKREQELAASGEQGKMGSAREKFFNEDIYFQYDSAVLTPEAQEILKEKAKWMNAGQVSVIVEGHCDERGTNEYNLALGERRAQSAKAFLVNLGIQPSRLTTISFGEERPAVPGNDESAWSKNRRAHFVQK